MLNNNFEVEPQSMPIGRTSVYAEIYRDRPNDRWSVTIVFSRAPGLPAIRGRDVDVQLLDAQGIPLHLLERPGKVLVEVGGGLGSSANALFQFQDSGVAPVQLQVMYHGQTVRFHIKQRT